MSGSEDERPDFGAADEPSLLHGKLVFYSSEGGPSLAELAGANVSSS